MKGFRLWAALGALLLVAACGDGGIRSPDFKPVLKSLTVAPKTVTLPAGRSQDLTATGTSSTLEGGTSAPFEISDATWTSDKPEYATVDNSNGTVTAVAQTPAGVTVTITAEKEGFKDTATITVLAPVAERIDIVDPADATRTTKTSWSLAKGSQQKFLALGVYSDGSKVPLDTAAWSLTPAAPIVATVAPPVGSQTTATGVNPGTVTLNVAATGFPGSTTSLVVGNAVPTGTGVRVDGPTGLQIGGKGDYNVFDVFSDGVERQIADSLVTYSSNNAGVANFAAGDDLTNGVITAIAEGDATVSAVLKPASGASGSDTQTLHVSANACTSPLRAPTWKIESSVVGVNSDTPGLGLCIGCTVNNAGFVIDGDTTNFATVNVVATLLDAGTAITIKPTTAGSQTPFPAGQTVSFIVARPSGTVLKAELLTSLRVSTLRGDAVQETAGAGATDTVALRVDLLGAQLIGGQSVDKFLVSLNTSKPFDGIRLSLTGVVAALTSLQVYEGCSATALPPVTITSFDGVSPTTASIEVGRTQRFRAQGKDASGAVIDIPDNYIVWSAESPTITDTTSTNGFFRGKAVGGPVTVTATLNALVPSTVTPRVKTATLNVTPAACVTPLAAPAATIPGTGASLLCLFCTVNNAPNIIDADADTFSTLSVPVGLLNAYTSVDVQSGGLISRVAGRRVGFVVSLPPGPIALVNVLGGFQVQTLASGANPADANAVIQSSTSDSVSTPLRLDLLGTSVISGTQTGIVSFVPTADYSGLRFKANSGLASVLTTVRVHQACTNINLP